MRKLLIRTFLWSLILVGKANAADVYDALNNVLNIPLVKVGSIYYTNVAINVEKVISVGSKSPNSINYDTYLTELNQLQIPTVNVGNIQYFNVVITVGNILSVGKSCLIIEACDADVIKELGKFILKFDGTVIDTVTGLTWMRCVYGQSWNGSSCIGNATSLAWLYASRLSGNVVFANQADWRLPSIRELSSLVSITNNSFGRLNTEVFKDAGALWSSTEWPNLAGDAAWHIWAAGSSTWVSYGWKGSQQGALLVRGLDKSSNLTLDRPNSIYQINTDGTTVHLPTGLMWKRCSEGQKWNGTTCSGYENVYTWEQSLALKTDFAGYSDWRAPTMSELLSLVVYEGDRPINKQVFPNTPTTQTWSTEAVNYPNFSSSSARAVDFGWSYGSTYELNKSNTYPVRLVRAMK